MLFLRRDSERDFNAHTWEEKKAERQTETKKKREGESVSE